MLYNSDLTKSPRVRGAPRLQDAVAIKGDTPERDQRVNPDGIRNPSLCTAPIPLSVSLPHPHRPFSLT